MADIRINALPSDTAPSQMDNVPIDGGTTRRATVIDLVNSGAPIASQAEAEAGTNATKRMTPLTTAQAIAAKVGTTTGTIAAGDDSRIVNAVQASRTLTAGTGLTGGGDLTADRSVALNAASIASLVKADGAIRFDAAQTLTSPQQAQAISNMGAATSAQGAKADTAVQTTAQTNAVSLSFGLSGVLNGIAPGFENNTYMYVANPIGRAAIVGFTRSSDNPTVGDQGTQGITAFVQHDSAKSAYAFYGEMRRQSSAGTSYGAHMAELNGLQFGQNAASVDPYNIYASGLFDGLRLTAGRTDVAGSTFSMSAAINIANNGATFQKGIVFGSTALTSNSGQYDCFNVPSGGAIQHWSAANTRGSRIRFDGPNLDMVFASDGLYIQTLNGASTVSQQSSSLMTYATPVLSPYYRQQEAAINLVNAANNNVVITSGQAWCQGPTAAFAITGIVALATGTELTILNDTGQNLTLSHLNGSSTAANQIWSPTGADLTTTGNGAVVLRYSGIKGKWMVVSWQP